MPKDQGAYGSGPGGGLGTPHGKIMSPQGPCGYEADPNGGDSVKGGVDYPPFGSHKETQSIFGTVTFDGQKANQDATGDIVTPMSTSSAAMPGLSGSSGTGPKVEGGISTPWGHGTAGANGSSTNGSGGSSPNPTSGMGAAGTKDGRY